MVVRRSASNDPSPWGSGEEEALRRDAMAWLTIRTNDGADSLTTDELLDFQFRGVPFRLMDAQAGIRKPAGWTAALSIRTVYTPEGKERPYEDRLGDDGLVRYKWRGIDPSHADNRALRSAMEQKVPLIWFFGVGTAVYKPIYPVYLLWEEVREHQFVVDPDVARSLVDSGSVIEERLKRYVMQQVKQRLHQPVFRATVMRAYENRCAICSLRHPELLDAAHIVPDHLEDGIASVRNGLALCKIHHAAFDSRILGIRPDLVVEIRRDLLDEIDGPMLTYGLQGCHQQRLSRLPKSRAERPDPTLLETTYRRFREAG